MKSEETRKKQSETLKQTWENDPRKLKSQLCHCGCGEMTQPGKMYVHGHNRRGDIFRGGGRKKERTLVPCDYCGNIIERVKSAVSKNNFCNRKCHHIWLIGKDTWNKGKHGIYSAEVIKQMSQNRRGKQLGKDNPFYGRHHTEDSLKRMIKVGTENGNWQGGKSFEPYGLDFNKVLKKEIRQRDNYTCQECGYTQEQLGYKLPVHHIDYDKGNNNPLNLISLCKSCHTKTNFDRTNWIDYYQNKISQVI